ncbi:MAG TPA: YeeE/YedE thiosulfate transporter family protein [Planctomycetota bacterium]
MPDIVGPLAGGALIGLAAAGMLLLKGKTAGVSGVLEGVVRLEKGELGWKLAFVAGLLAGGVAMKLLRPESFSTPAGSLGLAVVGGLLVGFGTRVGGGCTSGHGVCGVGRGSRRAIVATLVFMAAGMLTVLARRLA